MAVGLLYLRIVIKKVFLQLFLLSIMSNASGQSLNKDSLDEIIFEKPYHINGVLVNDAEERIPNTTIELQKGFFRKKTILITTTNDKGYFNFCMDTCKISSPRWKYIKVTTEYYKTKIVRTNKYYGTYCSIRYLKLKPKRYPKH